MSDYETTGQEIEAIKDRFIWIMEERTINPQLGWRAINPQLGWREFDKLFGEGET
ncbi:MAG: hypothetical protein ACXADW_24730 [Candidatus Hodarchaeales archaeon]|jgi:hypothetical protein